ncbi:MAG: tRNA 2-thiocytidine(32) synthetase TtcA [Chloroflexi bacterium]|nr:tRNA 2-thiocytidine(32) synthetase TtcA [Chloroflexota bacterium]
MSVRNLPLKDRLAYYLLKGMNKAIRDYGMIADGDRIAVAVSGGKDSFTLLYLLWLRQQSVRERYEAIAVHVRMHQADGTPCVAFDVRSALETAGLCQPSLEIVDIGEQPNDCMRCSFLRRKAIFETAQRLGCNKVALGHHADDAAETTLLNLIFHGKVETLYPKRQFFGGQITLIRPLIYLPEKRIARFAQACAFPLQAVACPHSANSRRAFMKNIIRMLEHEYPRVKINLFRAGLRPYSPVACGNNVSDNGF